MYRKNKKQMGKLENTMKDEEGDDDSVFSDTRVSDVPRMSQRDLYISQKEKPDYNDLRSSRMVSVYHEFSSISV